MGETSALKQAGRFQNKNINYIYFSEYKFGEYQKIADTLHVYRIISDTS